ncbi:MULTISPECIES: amino acid ABC transporter permease [Sodalis]|jgi:His/Glu/Gln/Arg/opine family amino acid ABC transporter permease subunit|uniref:Amino acid ABC transporter membrane protein 2 (PAAT family) n=1 Tax=Sodalis ligni TaxID=2697027 RepID=A0A4V2Q2I4_9GAMM|nr:amino acid ABC transporter permease [Sodalis ligni]TCL02968.1 amino acid ABC transporter membrane protein 2 (PAAT family) [Sodalis ligni]
MFSTSLTGTDLLYLLQGAGVTLELTLCAMLAGTVVGVVIGILYTLLPRLSIPLAWFMDIFRSVPLLIQFVLFNAFKSIIGLNWSAFAVACVVLGIYTASFCGEIVRGSVLSVPDNLQRAGRSLGMSRGQSLRHIVLPLALRVAFPSWLSLSLSVMKDTALVMWIGIIELLRASQNIITRIQEPLLVLCIAGAIYYLMSLVIARIGVRLEKRWQEND